MPAACCLLLLELLCDLCTLLAPFALPPLQLPHRSLSSLPPRPSLLPAHGRPVEQPERTHQRFKDDPADLAERERFVVPTTSAILSYTSAIGLLNNLGSLIPRDKFTLMHVPRYTDDYSATVHLPSSLLLPADLGYAERAAAVPISQTSILYISANEPRELVLRPLDLWSQHRAMEDYTQMGPWWRITTVCCARRCSTRRVTTSSTDDFCSRRYKSTVLVH
ncbi:hypothetical protein GY45DRAFT_1376382 [Cubamyces sp. BRFM 1775]|nr:hypothetical protein GY45DRAFT_1376382 [Cubamyces sp. BRFM 1775]